MKESCAPVLSPFQGFQSRRRRAKRIEEIDPLEIEFEDDEREQFRDDGEFAYGSSDYAHKDAKKELRDDFDIGDGDERADDSPLYIHRQTSQMAHGTSPPVSRMNTFSMHSPETPLYTNTIPTRPATFTKERSSNIAGTDVKEIRLVAPYVGRLSPATVVEVRFMSSTECVAILCSVDVLKMRSAYFTEILRDQDTYRDEELDERPFKDTTSSIWRAPITILDDVPSVAAAFVSCHTNATSELHEAQ